MIVLLMLLSIFTLSTRPSLAQTPPFTGTFVSFVDYAHNVTEAKITAFFNDLTALQMDTIILTPLQIERKSNNTCQQTTYTWSRGLLDFQNPDPYQPVLLDRYFTEAASRNIKVYFSLPLTGRDCPDYTSDPNSAERLYNYLANIGTSHPQNPLTYIPEHYGSSPSFAGWYIPNEPRFTYESNINPREMNYYKTVVSAIRLVSDKPILIAPSLVGTANQSPTTFAAKARDFYNGIRQPSDTNFIFAWQDSVAEIGTNNSWRQPLAGKQDSYNIDYYRALNLALGGSSRLWSDNEMGNCCVYPNYAWGSGILKPNTVARLEQQSQNSPLGVVGKRVVWIQQTQLATTDSSLNRAFGSDRLFHTYRAYYGLGNGEFIRPVSYKWLTLPSSNYPDTSNQELFDGLTGVPGHPTKNNYNPTADPRWVGVQGNTDITFSLGQPKNVDYLSLHLLRFNSQGIDYPTKYDFFCSQNSTDWEPLGSYNFPIANNVDGEFVMSNPNTSPFHRTCRFLRVTATNTKWTFLSEIEISSISRSPQYQSVSITPTSNISPTTPPSCPRFSQGDSNCDDKVDLVDFSAWKMIFITKQTSTRTDFNRDNATNLSDFAIWKSAFVSQNH